MKLLSIHGGLFAQIDDKDFERLSKFNWHLSRRRKVKFYITRSKYVGNRRSTKIYLHREVMDAKKGQIVDHKDRNVLNNQKSNLRFCSYGENNQNMHVRRDNCSGYKGVSFCNTYKKWLAVLSTGGKEMLRKKFNSKTEAVNAYNEACIKHHGEFALPNVMPTHGSKI